MSESVTTPSNDIASHFEGRDPAVRKIYDRLLAASRRLGAVVEEPKKTSIHLVRTKAFAGVATRRAAVILTLKSATDVTSPRIIKHEQASANRWHLDVRLESVQDVDDELRGWLAAAYALAG